jgi:MATE family multidrug resistance protein
MSESPTQADADNHPFVRAPHATLIGLAFPVLISLIAEPLTGLVDTAFVARLGAVSLAALGVGTTALSSVFWAFNFLQIGAQTEVAGHIGRNESERAAEISGLALLLSLGFGLLLVAVLLPAAGAIAAAMGADGDLRDQAITYIHMRALGAPAILLMVTAFGVLRGLQLMRIPLLIAVAVNLINVGLDALLIFGPGPFPALGVAGAALASAVSQWIGAVWAVVIVLRRLGRPTRVLPGDARKLLVVGGDLFIRTGLATTFLILTTRLATRIGPDAGAAQQAIRQIWIFSALFLDSFAITGQSLVGYFFGADRLHQARRVAALVCLWSLGFGAGLGLLLLLGRPLIELALLPPETHGLFGAAWLVAALVQPTNALAFATDGIHWGTGDYRYLRNAMLIATGAGALALLWIDVTAPWAFTAIWITTAVWGAIRAGLGLARIWPGILNAPLAARQAVSSP